MRLFDERVKIITTARPELFVELKKLGISQRQVAEHLRFSYQYINDVIKARRVCSHETAMKIQQYIDDVRREQEIGL